MTSRAACLAQDATDPLAPLRRQFGLESLDERGVIYLDGNSLGVLPTATAARVQQVVEHEWGVGLIRSWNPPSRLDRPRFGETSPESRLDRPRSGETSPEPRLDRPRFGETSPEPRLDTARFGETGPESRLASAHFGETGAGWITLSARIADKIAPLIGAGAGEVSVGDSTSVNLYKVLDVAVAMQKPTRRRQIVSERTNFPSDLYIADSVARTHGFELVLVDEHEVTQLDNRTAILLLTHVNYRTGRMHDMPQVTRAAHAAGALMIWDLSHSAGAVPVHLNGAGADEGAADFAVGCGYKYLNGGPGAPAFLWAHARHLARMDREEWRQPLAGWLGHAAPFAFSADYRPGTGISRFICGTPPVLSLAALECGVDTVHAANELGGLPALQQKASSLTDLFIALAESRCAAHRLRLASPRAAAERGCQVGFALDADGYAVMQALIERGVIGDFRAPDIIRFGFPPLYSRFVDVWDAVDRLASVLDSGAWREARFARRLAVT